MAVDVSWMGNSPLRMESQLGTLQGQSVYMSMNESSSWNYNRRVTQPNTHFGALKVVPIFGYVGESNSNNGINFSSQLKFWGYSIATLYADSTSFLHDSI